MAGNEGECDLPYREIEPRPLAETCQVLCSLLAVYNFPMQISTRAGVIRKFKANRHALTRYSVKSLALFGCAARDKMRKKSDIDVLVQFNKTTWANYIGLKFYLEDLLGQEVNLVTPKALKPATKPSIERDLYYVLSQPETLCSGYFASLRWHPVVHTRGDLG